jgi:hypothetical protein
LFVPLFRPIQWDSWEVQVSKQKPYTKSHTKGMESCGEAKPKSKAHPPVPTKSAKRVLVEGDLLLMP